MCGTPAPTIWRCECGTINNSKLQGRAHECRNPSCSHRNEDIERRKIARHGDGSFDCCFCQYRNLWSASKCGMCGNDYFQVDPIPPGFVKPSLTRSATTTSTVTSDAWEFNDDPSTISSSEIRATIGWSCTVCFTRNSRDVTTCRKCAAQRTGTRRHRFEFWNCLHCRSMNTASTTQCTACGRLNNMLKFSE